MNPPDPAYHAACRARLQAQARPPGSLGRLEALAAQIGAIQHSLTPRMESIEALILAGDHGLTEEGVNAYPASVTPAMVALILAGGASVSALARAVDVAVSVVDAGVKAVLPPHPALIDAKIRPGTRNAAREDALTPDEVARALAKGAAIAAARPADALAIGEMGIGNSSSAALLMHRLLPAPLEACIGLGAGQDAAGLARKQAAIARAAARSAAQAPHAVLAAFGGCELAMMAGAFIGGARAGKVMIVDGFIAAAAALAALRIEPGLEGRLVFAHVSAERGHRLLLDRLGAVPLLDLEMRLGEGTGAVLAAPLLRAACRLLGEVAPLAAVL